MQDDSVRGKSTVPNTTNAAAIAWIEEQVRLCRPDRVHWCDGSELEKEQLYDLAVSEGVLIRLNQEKLPGCYYHRSNPNDVARVEHCTYICTESEEDAGPINNWAKPAEMRQRLRTVLPPQWVSRSPHWGVVNLEQFVATFG